MHHAPHKNNLHLWLGLIAFVSGAVILLEKFELVPSDTWNYVWPVILVVFGVRLMVDTGCCEKPEPPKPEVKHGVKEEKAEKEPAQEKKSKKKKKK